MLRAYLARAWRDTVSQATDHKAQSIGVGLGGTFAVSAVRWVIVGWQQMSEELGETSIYALVGFVGGLVVMALWNLVAAPTRFHRDRADKAEGERDQLKALASFEIPDLPFRDAANELSQLAEAPRIYAAEVLRDFHAYRKLDIWAKRMQGDAPELIMDTYWEKGRIRGADDYNSDLPDTGLIFLEGRINGMWKSTHYDPKIPRSQFEAMKVEMIKQLKARSKG